MCSVRFGNKEIHQFLNKIGITPNKSKTLHLNIPLTSHIVRGVLDGDGCVKCVGDKRVSVEIATGSELFFNQLKTYLKQFLKVTGTFSNGLGLVRVCTQSEIVKFYDLLYADSNLYLERKHEKFLQGSAIKKFIDENAANSGKP
jgi:hypothetical protein